MHVSQTRVLFLYQKVTWASPTSMTDVCQQGWKEWVCSCAWDRIPSNTISASKLPDIFLPYLGLNRLGTLLVFTILLFSFWKLITFTRLHMTSKYMNHFNCKIILHVNVSILWILNVIIFVKVGLQPPLSLLLNLLGKLLLFSIAMLIFPAFYLKVYLQWSVSLREKLVTSWVSCKFHDKNRQCIPICAKMIYSLVKKVLSIAKPCMFLGTLCGSITSTSLAASVSILQAGDWARYSSPARCCFSTYITTIGHHQDSTLVCCPGP